MNIKTLLILSVLCSTTTAGAQRMIEGTIYDQNQQPLIGAKVAVKGDRALKAVTDEQGKYKLTVPQNQNITLQVSYLGYQSEQVDLSASENNRLFYLKEDKTDLNEVVVTGTRTPRV